MKGASGGLDYNCKSTYTNFTLLVMATLNFDKPTNGLAASAHPIYSVMHNVACVYEGRCDFYTKDLFFSLFHLKWNATHKDKSAPCVRGGERIQSPKTLLYTKYIFHASSQIERLHRLRM